MPTSSFSVKLQALIRFSTLSALIGVTYSKRIQESQWKRKTFLSKSTNPLSSVRDLVPNFPVSIGLLNRKLNTPTAEAYTPADVDRVHCIYLALAG